MFLLGYKLDILDDQHIIFLLIFLICASWAQINIKPIGKD